MFQIIWKCLIIIIMIIIIEFYSFLSDIVLLKMLIVVLLMLQNKPKVANACVVLGKKSMCDCYLMKAIFC